MLLPKRIYIPVAVFIFIILFSPGCKTKKLAIKSEKPQYKFSILDSIKTHKFDANWLSLKAKCTLNKDDQKTSFQYNLKMKRDSLIWVSVSLPLGIEGGRALIFQDSVVVMDRISNKVYTYSYGFFKKFLPFDADFDLIQNLIFCNPVFIEKNNLRADTIENQIKLISVNKELQSTLWFNALNFTLKKMNLEHFLLNYKAEIIYENYKKTEDAGMFPENISYTISGNQNIGIQINYNKITVNVPQEMPFKIPSKYIRVKME